MGKQNKNVTKLLNFTMTNGIEFLLPQNLTDEFLDVILLESKNMDNGIDSSPSILLLAVLHLEYNSKLTQDLVLNCDRKKVFEHMNIYIDWLKLERLRRVGTAKITEDQLPTLDNIFRNDRIIKIGN